MIAIQKIGYAGIRIREKGRGAEMLAESRRRIGGPVSTYKNTYKNSGLPSRCRMRGR